jgi:cation transport ATPase
MVVGWVFAGALFGFSLLALASIAVGGLTVALGAAPLLALRRVRSAWLFVVAASVAFFFGWMSLVVDPNAPDDSLWPLLVGALVAILAGVLYGHSIRPTEDESTDEAEGDEAVRARRTRA